MLKIEPNNKKKKNMGSPIIRENCAQNQAQWWREMGHKPSPMKNWKTSYKPNLNDR